jgi:hypothetical protein
MQGTVLYGPRDVRFEERDAPTIIKPTDAVIRISATCVCGSDLWPYRGVVSRNRCRLQVNRRLDHFRARILQLKRRPTLLFAAKS